MSKPLLCVFAEFPAVEEVLALGIPEASVEMMDPFPDPQPGYVRHNIKIFHDSDPSVSRLDAEKDANTLAQRLIKAGFAVFVTDTLYRTDPVTKRKFALPKDRIILELAPAHQTKD